MKKTLFPILTLSFLLSIIFLFTERQEPHSFKKKHKIPKKDRIDLAIKQEYQLTKDPLTNIVPNERLLLAKSIRDKKIARRAALRVSGINWQERGPSNVGGRTRALLFDLNDLTNKKVWAAGVGGGLWYTNDITAATPIWNKINDFFDNIAITTIVQNPANPQEMYFGTGEGWFNIDAIKGLGIWKSTDGGLTWNQLSNTSNFAYVNDLLIDKNGNLYASVREAYNSDADGVQKSSDGGTSWTQVLGAPIMGSSPKGADLELSKDGDIYASLGIGDNGGIYLSGYAANGANTGNAGTWVNITPNTAGTISTPANYWKRVELATAPSNNDIVYALLQGYNSNNCTSIQQYNKSTNTWSVKTVPTIIDQGSNSNFTRGQAWYDLIAAVDPNNANTLCIGGIDALRSTNGGTSWSQITTWSLYAATGFTNAQNIHADHHAIAFAPGSSSKAVWGTDGGVYYSENVDITSPGKPSFTKKNTGYNVTQFYSVAAHPTNTNYFLAGAQDNGTQKFTTAGINATNEVTGGDGAFCHIDQDNPNIQISSYVFNNYYVSTNGGTSFNIDGSFNDNGSFINPTDYDDAQNILYGGNTVGTYFRWNDPVAGGNTASEVSVSAFSGRSVTHVSVSPLSPNRVYFGLNNGAIVRVDDAHTGTAKSGTVIKPASGSISVSSIAIDNANEDHMLVTYTNYGITSIYESYNANQASPTWTAVEGNLPDMPVRWVVFDPRNSDWALIATELGVWSTDNLNGTSTSWEPTNSGLANVRVDMLQYRSSDRTLVAATHGRGIFTAVVPNVTTPDINFSSGTSSVSEQSTSSSGCTSYTDITVNMTIANAPVGNAMVTLNLKPGNTAVEGLDFDFTTNGDFSAPSHSLTFTSGSTANKSITVRIYNDAEIETSESFTLQYSLSGTTDAQAGSNYQEHLFSIIDNDIAPTAGSIATIGTATYILGNSSGAAPFNAKQQGVKTTMLYKASELSAQGLRAGYISSLAFNLQKNSARPYQSLQINMGLTSLNYLVDGAAYLVPTVSAGTYTSYNTVNGWNTFNLNAPFYWDGINNLVIEICYDNVTADAAQAADAIYGYSDGGATSQSNMYFQNSLTCNGSYNSVTTYGSGIKPVLQLTTKTTIATIPNTSRTEYLGPNSDAYFYASTGELIARIRNLTSHAYGCTQLTIDRGGNGATAFTNNTASNFLLNKTFHITPATNNSTGAYEITLYFTQAEVQAWEAATGQSWNNIQLVKVPSQISRYTPTTREPDGPGTVHIVTPTRGTLGSNYTLTYTFNNGFSGFGAGIPEISTLPVNLLSFQGKLVGYSGVLNWVTTYEQNSRVFVIEKSLDGRDFYSIGSINAKGTSINLNNYYYADNNLRALNYYRLKIVDNDGSMTYSQIVVIRYNDAPQEVTILKNPFSSSIGLQLSKKAQLVKLQLVDVNGTILEKKVFSKPTQLIHWTLQNRSLSKGVYVLQIVADQQTFIEKLIKE